MSRGTSCSPLREHFTMEKAVRGSSGVVHALASQVYSNSMDAVPGQSPSQYGPTTPEASTVPDTVEGPNPGPICPVP